MTEYATRQRLPVEATRGGAETMYPDYLQKMRTLPLPPPAAPSRAGGRQAEP
jgi:hypothetical protein